MVRCQVSDKPKRYRRTYVWSLRKGLVTLWRLAATGTKDIFRVICWRILLSSILTAKKHSSFFTSGLPIVERAQLVQNLSKGTPTSCTLAILSLRAEFSRSTCILIVGKMFSFRAKCAAIGKNVYTDSAFMKQHHVHFEEMLHYFLKIQSLQFCT